MLLLKDADTLIESDPIAVEDRALFRSHPFPWFGCVQLDDLKGQPLNVPCTHDRENVRSGNLLPCGR